MFAKESLLLRMHPCLKGTYIVGFFVSSLFFSCEKAPVQVDTRTFVFSSKDSSLVVTTDKRDPGHYFHRLNPYCQWGLSYEYKLTEEDIRSRLVLIVKGKVRSDHIYSTSAILATTFKGTKQMHWKSTNLRQQIVDLNSWNVFYDSLILPKNTKEEPFDRIVVQALLARSQNENFDLDSVTFNIKQVKN